MSSLQAQHFPVWRHKRNKKKVDSAALKRKNKGIVNWKSRLPIDQMG
ncbi:hypothetical protein CAY60_003840 [Shouchella clausii]|nr:MULTISPECIES: hypothetical protein [Shouchella]MBU3230236.1 hypothetical protein [Shouchella clausii]MBU3262565.1 hypothetical protein [Shouchella clausii]MBU3507120.1 hypothetical protein [Shouchella clausii]MBU3536747.1 hypothetical protein [Shouchella clausii]MBX0306494.1 hypothetical protein [Shouchella clausii]